MISLFMTGMLVMILFVGCPDHPSGGSSGSSSGGSSKGKDPQVTGNTYTIYSEPSMDGSVTWTGGANYIASAADTSINIGDWDEGVMGGDETVTRGFISYDLSSIPAGAQIKSAVLRVYQNSNFSGDSYANPPAGLGDVHVGWVSYTVFDNTTWDNGNWNANTIGILSTVFAADTWHTLDVTAQLIDELTTYQTGRLQFTIRHEHENNNDGTTADTDGWVMGNSLTNQPELVITLQ